MEPMNSPVVLSCRKHHARLQSRDGELACDNGCIFPVINQVPRFVPAENYSSSFGLQWNTFRSTQLDSFTGLAISRDRLTRIAGGSLDVFRGKTVLEAGCGAGRFTELMLEAGASVFACDLSSAVEANFKNCGGRPGYFVCQADLRELPVEAAQFDVVVCIGVIQHTPDPEDTIRVLASHVKPGGLLLIDHYAHDYPFTPLRRKLRAYLLKQSGPKAMRVVNLVVSVLWPVHRMLYRYRRNPWVAAMRQRFVHWSPVVDYHDAYAPLGERRLYEWALLDTHDTLTDRFKHLRTREQLVAHLDSLGLVEVGASYAGNGVEARARKPILSGGNN